MKLTNEQLIEILRRMMRIRHFEEKASELSEKWRIARLGSCQHRRGGHDGGSLHGTPSR